LQAKSNTLSNKIACFEMPTLKDTYSIGRTADHIEREAYEKGYATGEKAGFEMGEEKAKVLIDKLEALLVEVATLRTRMVRQLEPQCVELSVSIARKILARELTAKPEEIVKMAKEGLLKLERTGLVTVKVNPLLFDFFMKHKPDLARIHPEIAFDADPSVSRFGTVVMGPVEDVVTDLDEQLRNLIKDIGERLGHE
jgi:flagellar assembly protein FliH